MSSRTTVVAPLPALDAPAAVGRAVAPRARAGAGRHVAVPSGLREALQQLNATTRFRFTALYRAERSTLVGVWVHDRENPLVNGGAAREAPACCYRAAGIVPPPTTVPDSMRSAVADRWHDVHTLREGDGTLLGVICHSDARPRLANALAWADGEPMVIAVAEWLATVRLEAAVARRRVTRTRMS